MDIEDAVRLRLIEDASIAAQVAVYMNSKSVFWVLRAQDSVLPAIVLTWVSADWAEHMKGLQSLRFARLQVDTYALSVVAAQQLRDAAIACLQPRWRGHGYYFRPASIFGPRDFSDAAPNGPIFRTSTDFMIRFSPA